MAEGGGDLFSMSLEKLDAELTCPVCTEHFKEPKVLPCLHYYCKTCIADLIKRANGQPFNCPECRREAQAAGNNPESFPAAFFVNRMEDVFSVMKKAEPKDEGVKCESCEKLPAIDFCHNCSEYICTKCSEAHKNMRKLSSHIVVSIVSLRSTISKSPPEKTLVVLEAKCNKHTDEPLKLYCYDCHKLVCRDCTLIDHKDHNYAFVVDVAPKSKAKIQQNTKAVKKLSQSLRLVRSSLDESKKKLSNCTTSTMFAIDAAIDKLTAKLAQKRVSLKEKATRMMAEAEDKLAVQDKNAELAVGEVESLVEFMNRTLERATDQEVLSLEKQMSDQVERVRQLYSNPADKFPVPTLPEPVVQCGKTVEEAIETDISIVETPDKKASTLHSYQLSAPPLSNPKSSRKVENDMLTGLYPDALSAHCAQPGFASNSTVVGSSTSPFRPSPLAAILSKPPNSATSPAPSFPSSAMDISSMVSPTGPYPGDVPTGQGANGNDLDKPRDPSTKGRAEGSCASSANPADTSEKAKDVLTGLSPDALALVQRLPEGNIAGVKYHIQEGYIRITTEGKKKMEETITKFQDLYKRFVGPGQKLWAENVQIPDGCSKEGVRAEIANFEQKYIHTAFVLNEEKQVVRVISHSRQFDQAKLFFKEALQKLVVPPSGASAPDPVLALKVPGNRTLTLKRGDIVKEKADILVNAANGHLDHAGGVAGALNAASQGELQKYSKKFMETQRRGNEVPVGEAVFTHGGGNLACKYVIHAVGPEGYKYSQVQCERLVKQAVSIALKMAERLNARSIVIPAISCGICAVKSDLVSSCIVDTILGFNYTKPSPCLSDIRIVILNKATHSCFAKYFELKGTRSKKGSSRLTSPPTKSSGEATVSRVILSVDDLAWIKPILKPAAPKWRRILLKIGLAKETISKMSTNSKDDELLLNMGLRNWLKQKSSHGADVEQLLSALQSSEVGEKGIALEIIAAVEERLRNPSPSTTGLSYVEYPKLPVETDTLKATKADKAKAKECPICMEEFVSPVTTACKHQFCKDCLEKALSFDPYCPACKTPLRTIIGKQPQNATMNYQILKQSVAGYEGYQTIEIHYKIPDGIQSPKHPNPGKPYKGTYRVAYLPYNNEGWEVLKLLERAFQARIIFTIGTSASTGTDNVVVWNDIHHKTSTYGGQYGYPDPTYLQRVKHELAIKGIVPDSAV